VVEEIFKMQLLFSPLKTEGYPVAVAESRKASRGSMQHALTTSIPTPTLLH